MSINNKVTLVLPNKGTCRLVTNTPITEDGIDKLRTLFSASSSISVDVMFDEDNPFQSKKRSIILWGDVLKNSYLVVDHD